MTLPTSGQGNDAERAAVRRSMEVAARDLGHETVGATTGSVGGGAETSAALVAIGKASRAQWVVATRIVSATGTTQRVELRACQVATGRVETLERDVSPRGDVPAQLEEVLALLVRPEGVGDDPLPWGRPDRSGAEAVTSRRRVRFGDGGSVTVGAGAGALYLLGRPSDARGSRAEAAWSIVAAVGVPAAPGLDLTARFGGLAGAGTALRGEVGARLMFPVVPRVGLGLAASGGVFGQTGGARIVRPLVGASVVIAWALARHFELGLEVPQLRVGFGGEAPLTMLGGEAMLFVRF